MRWTFLMKHVNLIGTGHTAKETRHRRTRESDPRPPRQTQWAWLRAWTHCEGMDAPWATNILVTVILVTYSGDSTWLLRGKEKWKRKNVCLRLGTNLRLPGILVKAKALGDHSASCHHCQHPWLLRPCCPAQCCSFLQEVIPVNYKHGVNHFKILVATIELQNLVSHFVTHVE